MASRRHAAARAARALAASAPPTPLGVAHATRPFAPPPPLPARGVAPPKPRPGRADPGGGGSARARGFAPPRGFAASSSSDDRVRSSAGASTSTSPPASDVDDPPRDAAPSPFADPRVFSLCAVTCVLMAGHSCVAPVLPAFAGEFGASATEVGTTLSAFALARLLLNVPLGRAADAPSVGRKPLLVAGAAATAVGMLGSAFAPDLPTLLAWRFVAGAGSAAYAAGSHAMLADLSVLETRARILGANQAGVLAGAALGPAIGGLVAAEFGTRAPFALVAGGAALAAAHAHVFVRETLSRVREGDSEAERGRRGAEAEAGLDAGLDSREEGSEGSEGSERSERASAFVRRERVGEEGGTPRRSDHAMHNMDSRVEPPSPSLGALLTTTPFASACALNAALFFSGAGGRATLLPLLASERFAFGPAETGAAFAGMALASLLSIGPGAAMADRLVTVGDDRRNRPAATSPAATSPADTRDHQDVARSDDDGVAGAASRSTVPSSGRTRLIFPCVAASSAAMVSTACSDTSPAFVGSALAWAGAHSLMGPAPSARAADVAPRRIRGAALSAFRTSGDLGMMLGPVALGALADEIGTGAALGANAAAVAAAGAAFHWANHRTSGSGGGGRKAREGGGT